MGDAENPDARWPGPSCDGRRLFRLAYGVLRNVQAAEDAVQQAMLKGWKHRAELRDSRAIERWLCRVVVNESFLVLRRGKSEGRALDARSRCSTATQIPGACLEDSESVLWALSQLEEPTRMIVVLRIMHGVSGNDVAAEVGLSASEVSRRLHLGMDRLRACLCENQNVAGR